MVMRAREGERCGETGLPCTVMAECDGLHDQLLHLVPAIHDLRISDPDHVVAQLPEKCIVSIVLVALRACMGGAIDLQHQSVADEKVHAMPVHPGLTANGESEPTEPKPHIRFETGIGEWAGISQHSERRSAQGERLERKTIDHALVQGGVPRCDGVLVRLAVRDRDEHIGDGIGESETATRSRRCAVVQSRSGRPLLPSRPWNGEMQLRRVSNPELQACCLAGATQCEPIRGGEDQRGVCARSRHPTVADAQQSTRLQLLRKVMAAQPGLEQRRGARHTAIGFENSSVHENTLRCFAGRCSGFRESVDNSGISWHSPGL